MVNDNRNTQHEKKPLRSGDPLRITGLKVNMLKSEHGIRLGILRLVTEEGIEGWCNNVTEDMARMLAATYRDKLVGQDAMARERLWHDMLMWERFTWPPKGLRGAVDIALWDLVGKRMNQPVWHLLGACRDKVPAYRTQSGTLGPEGHDVEHFVNFALEVQAAGYKGSKDHCYGGPKFVIELARELRNAVGPDFHLMHDAVQHYDVKEAIRVGRALDEHGYTWFEEPLRDHNFLGLKQVREALELSVVAGEYFPHQLHSYAQMFALGAVDGIKPPIWVGGITEAIKLAHLAESFGGTIHVQAADAMWGFASIHANGGIENMVMLEVHPPFADQTHPAVRNPLVVEDGYVHMPQGAGLGVDLDWDMIEDETAEIIE